MNLLVYTLGAAAKASGKSKATISKAIKSGRLSALKDEMGVYRIEPAELNRVYPFNVDGNQDRTARTPEETPEKEDSFRELQARLEAAHERSVARTSAQGLLGAAVRLRLRPRSARLRQGGPVPRR